MLIDRPGIYPNVSLADYFKDPCERPSLTQSLAKVVIGQSALHARNLHPRLRPPDAEETEDKKSYNAAQAIGSAAHRLLIGRGKDIEVIRADNFRGREAQTARADATEAGRIAILEKHYARALEMTSAAHVQIRATGWDNAFVHGRGEVCIAWQEDGIWFRSLIDWMESPTVFVDYKTTGASFAPHTISLKGEADGWDIQAAMQERGLAVLDPKQTGRRHYRFVCQENYEPFALVAVELPDHWLEMGRKKLDMAIDIWRRAMTTGIWPSYPTMPVVPDYPSFREAAFLDRETIYHDNLDAMTQPRDVPSDIVAGG